jgi:hypothetical protein
MTRSNQSNIVEIVIEKIECHRAANTPTKLI